MKRPILGSPSLPAWIFLAGAVLSTASAFLLRQGTDHDAQLQFRSRAELLAKSVDECFDSAVLALKGLRAYLAAQPQLGREQFARYLRARDLAQDLPGLDSVTWHPRVQRAELAAYQHAQKQAQGEHFQVLALPQWLARRGAPADAAVSAAGSDAADLFPAQWVEPEALGVGLVGLDLASLGRWRSAIERSARSAQPALAPMLSGAAASPRGAGLLLVLPHYGGAVPPQQAQRLQALQGVLVAALHPPTLLAAEARHAGGLLQFELGGEGLQLSAAAAGERAARFEHRQQLVLVGSEFELRVRSTPQFEALVRDDRPGWMFLGGVLVSGLLAALVWQLGESRRQALALARSMTQDLERLAMVARRTVNAVIITDAQGCIRWANAGFERISGYSLPEVLGCKPGSLLQCPQTERATVARIGAALRAGQGVRAELLNQGKGGRQYWLDIDIQPLHDEQGRLNGFMAVETDITDHRQAEAALRASQAFLDQTGRIAGVGGFAIDPASGELRLSDQVLRILELPAGSRPTLAQCLAMVPALAARTLQQIIEQRDAKALEQDAELPLRTASGRTVWLRVRAQWQAYGAPGERLVGAVQDITAHRQLQDRAMRQQALLRAAIEAVDHGFVLYDPDDRLVYCNEKYREVYRTSADFIVPGARFEDILRTGAHRGQYPQAVGRVEEWVAERLADGHLAGIRADITDLVNATRAAEEASRAKSEFIATISHELRTPLQSINGYSELGQYFAQQEGRRETADMFGVVLGAGQRMLHLVNDLLDLSAVDAASLALNRGPEDLRSVAQQMMQELAPLAAARQVQLRLAEALPPLPVLGERRRLQQVLRNVLANAIRFAPAGSAIVIDGRDQGTQGVQLSVRDQGPGIPEAELEAIFDPFVQSSRTRDGSGGSGLGLAVCRRIMHAHGGSIRAENAQPNGAVLHIGLPALPTAAPPASAAAAPALAAPTTESLA